MRTKIEVKKRDIELGKPSPAFCPVARAVGRRLKKNVEVHVDGGEIVFFGKEEPMEEWCIPMLQKVSNFVGTSGSTVYVTDEGRVLIDDILEIRGMESRKWIVGQ